MAGRLKERYEREVLPRLVKAMGYKNPLQAPRLDKIVLNIGLGEAIQNAKALDVAVGFHWILPGSATRPAQADGNPASAGNTKAKGLCAVAP